MEEGEPFSQEEMDEMLQAAVDPDKGTILYKDFVTLMLPEEEQTWSSYSDIYSSIVIAVTTHITSIGKSTNNTVVKSVIQFSCCTCI